MDTTPVANKSHVYCNGKKLTDFTAKTTTGAVKLTLGDIHNTNSFPFDGSITFFSILKHKKND